jgi:hypothetical protein
MDAPSAPVANIGTGERRKRLTWGIVALAVGGAIAAMLAMIRAPFVWRLPLFFLFLFAALGIFQARDKT